MTVEAFYGMVGAAWAGGMLVVFWMWGIKTMQRALDEQGDAWKAPLAAKIGVGLGPLLSALAMYINVKL